MKFKRTKFSVLLLNILFSEMLFINMMYVVNSNSNACSHIKVTAENKPDNFLDVKYISQENNIAAGCESVSATMLLNFLGYNINERTFVDKYLLWEKLKEIGKDEQTGEIIYAGPDPRTEAYAGSPYEDDIFPNCGFGCFAKVIEKSINNYFGEIKSENHQPVAIIGEDLKNIAQDYVQNKKIPVLVWATINMKESTLGPRVWKTSDGGEHRWRRSEHCLLLVGFNNTHYFFADPYNNLGIVGYEKDLVEERYKEMGKEVLVINTITNMDLPENSILNQDSN